MRKYVVFFGDSFPDAFQLPWASVFVVDLFAIPAIVSPRATRRVRPETASPPSVTLPLRRHVFVFFTYEAWMPRMSGSPTNARVSNVPARLAVPTPGLYGVKSPSHLMSPP